MEWCEGHDVMLAVIRSAGQRNISADELVSKLDEGSLKWSKASLQVLHRLWSEQGAAVHAQQQVQAALRIGQVRPQSLQSVSSISWVDDLSVWIMCSLQVVDVQWRLGMAVSSDICRSLNSPYVTLLLKIAEPSGLICQKSFEMSVPQFQVSLHPQELWCSTFRRPRWRSCVVFFSYRTSTSSLRRWLLWWRLYEDQPPPVLNTTMNCMNKLTQGFLSNDLKMTINNCLSAHTSY